MKSLSDLILILEDLRDFLISREDDIALSIENFGDLKDLFILVTGREPVGYDK